MRYGRPYTTVTTLEHGFYLHCKYETEDNCTQIHVTARSQIHAEQSSACPGHSDITLRKHRTCVFVNGCLWLVHEDDVVVSLQFESQVEESGGGEEREDVHLLKPVFLSFLFSRAFLSSLASLSSTFLTSSAGGKFSGTMPRLTIMFLTAVLLSTCSFVICVSP